MLLKWIKRIAPKSSRRTVYEQLQWQRFLLRTGVPATVQILDMVEEGDALSGYVQLRLWVVLKLKEVIIYRHMQTLLNKKQMPSIGDTIHIRYCPDDLSRIVIV